MINIPKTGQARVFWLNGKVTEFLPASQIQVSDNGMSFLLARDDDATTAAILVPALSIAQIAFYTDEEVKKMQEEAAKKKRQNVETAQ